MSNNFAVRIQGPAKVCNNDESKHCLHLPNTQLDPSTILAEKVALDLVVRTLPAGRNTLMERDERMDRNRN